MPPGMAMNSDATGLDIPVRKHGFWRMIAASRVEPERGRPEMKWIVLSAPVRLSRAAVADASR